MRDETRRCIGCGIEVPIARYREGKGPFCLRCMTTGAPTAKPAYDYPTAFSWWGVEEDEAIWRVVNSGRFTMGPEVAAFENEFALWHGRQHGIMVNSGSSANLLMVSALCHLGLLKAGDRAIVPAIAWSTTYAPLVQHGIDLVLCDVDDTWNEAHSDFSHTLASVLGRDKIALVMGCSILGNPARLERLRQFADKLEATFIEDNCESLGAQSEGTLTGTFGLMSSFSFFHSHQISAIEGGMILTDSDECATICRMLRAHGWSRDVEPPSSFDREYDFRLFGYNVRPLEMHAAIAREQLKKLPGFIEARRENLKVFRHMTRNINLRHPLIWHDTFNNDFTSPFGIPFEVADAKTRARLVEALRKGGIDCRLPTGGSFRKHAYGLRWGSQHTPRADQVHERGLFLGNAPYDIEGKIEKAARIIGETLCTA